MKYQLHTEVDLFDWPAPPKISGFVPKREKISEKKNTRWRESGGGETRLKSVRIEL